MPGFPRESSRRRHVNENNSQCMKSAICLSCWQAGRPIYNSLEKSSSIVANWCWYFMRVSCSMQAEGWWFSHSS